MIGCCSFAICLHKFYVESFMFGCHWLMKTDIRRNKSGLYGDDSPAILRSVGCCWVSSLFELDSGRLTTAPLYLRTLLYALLKMSMPLFLSGWGHNSPFVLDMIKIHEPGGALSFSTLAWFQKDHVFAGPSCCGFNMLLYIFFSPSASYMGLCHL